MTTPPQKHTYHWECVTYVDLDILLLGWCFVGLDEIDSVAATFFLTGWVSNYPLGNFFFKFYLLERGTVSTSRRSGRQRERQPSR